MGRPSRRTVRASMADVMGETWIGAARSFGSPRPKAGYGYAPRVGILPAMTPIGLGLGGRRRPSRSPFT